MFRQIIFVIMLGWVLVLSGCAAIDKGHNIEGEDYKSYQFPYSSNLIANPLKSNDPQLDLFDWSNHFKSYSKINNKM